MGGEKGKEQSMESSCVERSVALSGSVKCSGSLGECFRVISGVGSWMIHHGQDILPGLI